MISFSLGAWQTVGQTLKLDVDGSGWDGCDGHLNRTSSHEFKWSLPIASCLPWALSLSGAAGIISKHLSVSRGVAGFQDARAHICPKSLQMSPSFSRDTFAFGASDVEKYYGMRWLKNDTNKLFLFLISNCSVKKDRCWDCVRIQEDPRGCDLRDRTAAKEVFHCIAVVRIPLRTQSAPRPHGQLDLITRLPSSCHYTYTTKVTLINWLVVLTILQNINQWEGLSHVLWNIKKCLKPLTS